MPIWINPNVYGTLFISYIILSFFYAILTSDLIKHSVIFKRTLAHYNLENFHFLYIRTKEVEGKDLGSQTTVEELFT